MASTSSSPTAERPHKRTRVEDDDMATVIVKSTDLWLPDGNILLRTISMSPTFSTPRHTLYKVHKGVLALHSSVFRDLFDGPQTAFDVGSESYEDLPVMDMPDAPDDVAHFLRALYFPKYTQRHHGTPRLKALPDGYAGILRLATKYDVQSLRDTTVAAFRLVWPSKLADWDALQKNILKDGPMPNASPNKRGNASRLYSDPAQAIRLAIDCNVPEVLPVAYYDLARVSARNGRFAPKHFRVSDTSVLTAAELEDLIAGMGDLQDVLTHHLFPLPKFMQTPGRVLTNCQHVGFFQCTNALRALWFEQITNMHASSGDVLTWLQMVTDKCERVGACAPCTGAVKDDRLRWRDTIWRFLPKYFNLRKRVGEDWGKN